MIDQTNEAAMRARAYQLLETQRDDRKDGQKDVEAPRGDATDDRPPTVAEGTGDRGALPHEDGISLHPAQDGVVEVHRREVPPN